MATATLTYGRNSLTKEYSGEMTVATLATQNNLKFLGAPADSVKFVIEGSEVELSTAITDGDEVYVEQKPHNKASEDEDDSISVTLTYGRNSITRSLDEGSLVSEIATQNNLKFLGAPADSVKFVYEGDEITLGEELSDGMEIYVEQKPHNKAK